MDPQLQQKPLSPKPWTEHKVKIKAIRRNPKDQAKKEETHKLFNRLAMNTHIEIA